MTFHPASAFSFRTASFAPPTRAACSRRLVGGALALATACLAPLGAVQAQSSDRAALEAERADRAAEKAALRASEKAARKGEPTPARKGKLLLTGGVSSVEGPAGGGITPWAVIGTHSTGTGLGASAALAGVKTRDYKMVQYGAAIGFGERAELSIARQVFDTERTGAALGLPGLKLKQNILGGKLRVIGDAVLDSDNWLPQVAVGLQYKEVDVGGLAGTLAALGARRNGVDVYVSATKLFLAQGILVNGTLRATKANQGGLLGFGGTGKDSYKLVPEISVAYLLRPDLAIGFEYRAKPDNLSLPTPAGNGLRETDWKDVFVAWAPSKNFSLTAAYVDLGYIVPAVATKRQTGGYVSAQVAY